MEQTWISSTAARRIRKPLFEIGMLNVRTRTDEDLPRTTNSLEGWRRAFEQRISIKHPTATRLIEKIRTEQASWEDKLQELRCGIRLKESCSEYTNLN